MSKENSKKARGVKVILKWRKKIDPSTWQTTFLSG